MRSSVSCKLKDKKQAKCRTSTGLFEVLNDKFMPKHYETIISLQSCKFTRGQNENAKERIGCPRKKANAYGYEHKERRLKEQFIDSIDDDEKMTEITQELTEIGSEQV